MTDHDDYIDPELERRIERALAVPDREPSPAGIEKIRRAASAASSSGSAPSHRRRRLPLVAAACAILIAGVAAGIGIDRLITDDDDLLARGTDEFTVELTGDGVSASVEGDAAPEGRIVTLRSETLPVIPPGEFYELWFVEKETGDLISAGTFHPDEEGNTVVVLHAAVDPSTVELVQVTREPGDGDPAPTDDVVAQGTIEPVD